MGAARMGALLFAANPSLAAFRIDSLCGHKHMLGLESPSCQQSATMSSSAWSLSDASNVCSRPHADQDSGLPLSTYESTPFHYAKKSSIPQCFLKLLQFAFHLIEVGHGI